MYDWFMFQKINVKHGKDMYSIVVKRTSDQQQQTTTKCEGAWGGASDDCFA